MVKTGLGILLHWLLVIALSLVVIFLRFENEDLREEIDTCHDGWKTTIQTTNKHLDEINSFLGKNNE